jgi:phage-related protein
MPTVIYGVWVSQKSNQTPKRDLQIALKRMQKLSNND